MPNYKGHRMSAAARRKISLVQKARWAAKRSVSLKGAREFVASQLKPLTAREPEYLSVERSPLHPYIAGEQAFQLAEKLHDAYIDGYTAGVRYGVEFARSHKVF